MPRFISRTHPNGQNISNHERGFRVCFGMALLTAMTTGLFATPAGIVIFSLTGVYQVLTAINGNDPLYALANRLPAIINLRA
jgi:hypothetical protein